jgi:SAM-dependent methyltransferase
MLFAMGDPSASPGKAAWDLDELAHAGRFANWVFDTLVPAASGFVVEVGPGVGTFSRRLLIEPDVERLLLLEPDNRCRATLEEAFRGDARVSIAADRIPGSATLAAGSGTADLVVCQNVLEHVEDDLGALVEIRGALRESGHLALLVPAHPSLYGRLDVRYGHHRRYTRDSLGGLLARGGFSVERMRSFNLLGVPGWWLATHMPGDARIRPRWLSAYDAALRVWRPLEDRIRPAWGLSLVAIARPT